MTKAKKYTKHRISKFDFKFKNKNNKCLKQFPDCPKKPSRKHCYKCPYWKEK